MPATTAARERRGAARHARAGAEGRRADVRSLRIGCVDGNRVARAAALDGVKPRSREHAEGGTGHPRQRNRFAVAARDRGPARKTASHQAAATGHAVSGRPSHSSALATSTGNAGADARFESAAPNPTTTRRRSADSPTQTSGMPRRVAHRASAMRRQSRARSIRSVIGSTPRRTGCVPAMSHRGRRSSLAARSDRGKPRRVLRRREIECRHAPTSRRAPSDRRSSRLPRLIR